MKDFTGETTEAGCGGKFEIKKQTRGEYEGERTHTGVLDWIGQGGSHEFKGDIFIVAGLLYL